MQRERLNKQNKPDEEKKEGYIIMPNNFLAEWIRVIGKGPVLLYLQMLTYCHKEKDIAWPALSTLGDSLDMSKNYRSNLYKVTPMRSPKNGPGQVQNLDTGSPKIALDQVQKLHPNNTNLNSTNLTATTKRKKDAVVVVNFKKLKKEGEERMRALDSSKEHYTGQAIRERMVESDFKEEFVEKILKEYSTKKIDEKLDLLMDKKNIQNPAGWLRTALKNDYQGEEPSLSFPRRRESSECHDESRIDSRFRGNDKERGGNDIIPNVIANDRRERGNPKHVNLNSLLPSPLEGEGQGEGDKILSTEETRRRFHSLREQLKVMKTPYSSP